MAESTKSFRTLKKPSGPCLFKEQKSRFIGLAYPADSIEKTKSILEDLKKTYRDASHISYAYRIGWDPTEVRANDDGEPTYSAGVPILGQIESNDLFNVLICVVRYYGGVKLGVGGLIQAYKRAAQESIGQAGVFLKKPQRQLELRFEYPQLDVVMRMISQHQLRVKKQDMHLDCRLILNIKSERYSEIKELFSAIEGVSIRLL
ncbi:IMPACT family protein [Robiginitalea sp. IMCC43444]|uniref:IMPACT family protein n=1 Tax=Robiginitalea sp. IMCC43444 TaxID=3459121 RepID=UPI0040432601